MVEDITFDGELARGFYSPAKKVDMGEFYMIFVSGIQPGKEIGDIEGQTTDVFEKIGELLRRGGATFDDVVKAVIYVTNMEDFEVISRIRENYFAMSKPVSTLVEVGGMTHENSKVEIEVTAVVKKEGR